MGHTEHAILTEFNKLNRYDIGYPSAKIAEPNSIVNMAAGSMAYFCSMHSEETLYDFHWYHSKLFLQKLSLVDTTKIA